MGSGIPPRNPIGRNVSRLRSEQDWSQEHLATLLQCEGVDASRDMLARVELCITRVNLEFLLGLQRVFRLPIVRFFSKPVQDLDAFYTQHPGVPLPESDPPKKPKKRRRKCQKLTKRRKPR
jgi:transcriptional regulator with XRE-family HTH domain